MALHRIIKWELCYAFILKINLPVSGIFALSQYCASVTFNSDVRTTLIVKRVYQAR